MGGSSSVLADETPSRYTNDKKNILTPTPPPGCPMHAGNDLKLDNNNKPLPEINKNNESLLSLPSGCPMHAGNAETNQDEIIDLANMMPPPNQRPSPGQPFFLNTHREKSTIPRGGLEKPDNWQYPSEQMFWNAMLRKGWRWEKEALSKEDMSHIIRIHNTNNERAWQEILLWESFHSECHNPKLLKFGGRAKDYSPRARFRALMGNDLPFDRHDWIVDRCGRHVRYIIDYYDIGDENGYKTGEFVELDVRPAFDSFSAVIDRSRACLLRKAAGVYQWWKDGKPSPPPKQNNESTNESSS